jgi:RsiW-degrading membrane proteinase PrsW (M82 family)
VNIYFAIILAVLFPIGFLAFLGSQNVYGTGKFKYNLLSMGWGIAAYFLAAYVNSTIYQNHWLTVLQIKTISAPIAEEMLKCLIVFYLIRRRDFVYILDGTLYGFGAGIGFAVLENIQYIMQAPSGMALSLALARIFSVNIIHATGTAIIGSALGYSRLSSDAGRIFIPLGGLLFAMAAHAGFNSLVNNGVALVFAFIYTGVGIFVISLIVRYGLRKASIDIQNNISMLDSITANEAALVNRMRTLDEALKPMEKYISPDDLEKVRDFLILQAQLGLQRNNLKNTQNGPLRDGIVQEIDGLKKRFDEARRGLGAFCMLQVRGLFPENNIPFWAILEQRVPAAGTGRAGGGLWTNLENRTKEARDANAK